MLRFLPRRVTRPISENGIGRGSVWNSRSPAAIFEMIPMERALQNVSYGEFSLEHLRLIVPLLPVTASGLP